MAYQAPVFNLEVDIYSVVLPSTKTYRLTSLCNLAMGRRQAFPVLGGGPGAGVESYTPALMLPAGTDIRCRVQGVEDDICECPRLSGRWYQVCGVDDVGKGFANEYRFAFLRQIGAYSGWVALGIPWWPVPMP